MYMSIRSIIAGVFLLCALIAIKKIRSLQQTHTVYRILALVGAAACRVGVLTCRKSVCLL